MLVSSAYFHDFCQKGEPFFKGPETLPFTTSDHKKDVFGVPENKLNRQKLFGVMPPNFFEKNFYTSYTKLAEIKLITIGLASPERIRRWAEKTLPNGKIIGQVTNANTLHHKTLKPQKGGLFCERIFGPLKDFECACGKTQKPLSVINTPSTGLPVLPLSNSMQSLYNESLSPSFFSSDLATPFFGPQKKGQKKQQLEGLVSAVAPPNNLFKTKLLELKTHEKLSNLPLSPNSNIVGHSGLFGVPEKRRSYCSVCDVEYTWSIMRRYQLGFIDLFAPVIHVWYLKATPSYLSILLDIKKKHLEQIIYCSETMTLENSYKFFSFFETKNQKSSNYSLKKVKSLTLEKSLQFFPSSSYFFCFFSGATKKKPLLRKPLFFCSSFFYFFLYQKKKDPYFSFNKNKKENKKNSQRLLGSSFFLTLCVEKNKKKTSQATLPNKKAALRYFFLATQDKKKAAQETKTKKSSYFLSLLFYFNKIIKKGGDCFLFSKKIQLSSVKNRTFKFFSFRSFPKNFSLKLKPAYLFGSFVYHFLLSSYFCRPKKKPLLRNSLKASLLKSLNYSFLTGYTAKKKHFIKIKEKEAKDKKKISLMVEPVFYNYKKWNFKTKINKLGPKTDISLYILVNLDYIIKKKSLILASHKAWKTTLEQSFLKVLSIFQRFHLPLQYNQSGSIPSIRHPNHPSFFKIFLKASSSYLFFFFSGATKKKPQLRKLLRSLTTYPSNLFFSTQSFKKNKKLIKKRVSAYFMKIKANNRLKQSSVFFDFNKIYKSKLQKSFLASNYQLEKKNIKRQGILENNQDWYTSLVKKKNLFTGTHLSALLINRKNIFAMSKKRFHKYFITELNRFRLTENSLLINYINYLTNYLFNSSNKEMTSVITHFANKLSKINLKLGLELMSDIIARKISLSAQLITNKTRDINSVVLVKILARIILHNKLFSFFNFKAYSSSRLFSLAIPFFFAGYPIKKNRSESKTHKTEKADRYLKLLKLGLVYPLEFKNRLTKSVTLSSSINLQSLLYFFCILFNKIKKNKKKRVNAALRASYFFGAPHFEQKKNVREKTSKLLSLFWEDEFLRLFFLVAPLKKKKRAKKNSSNQKRKSIKKILVNLVLALKKPPNRGTSLATAKPKKSIFLKATRLDLSFPHSGADSPLRKIRKKLHSFLFTNQQIRYPASFLPYSFFFILLFSGTPIFSLITIKKKTKNIQQNLLYFNKIKHFVFFGFFWYKKKKATKKTKKRKHQTKKKVFCLFIKASSSDFFFVAPLKKQKKQLLRKLLRSRDREGIKKRSKSSFSSFFLPFFFVPKKRATKKNKKNNSTIEIIPYYSVNKIRNNIYSLSHRYRWENIIDWRDFLEYSSAPLQVTDKLLAKYEFRLNPSVIISTSFAFQKKGWGPNNFGPEITQSLISQVKDDLSMNSYGASVIEKLLNELNLKTGTPEINQIDKQNRNLLYQLNKQIYNLKFTIETFKSLNEQIILSPDAIKVFLRCVKNLERFRNKDDEISIKQAKKRIKDLVKQRDLLTRRTKLIRQLVISSKAGQSSSSMILSLLPVLPPDLRPIVKMGTSGTGAAKIAASDLNRLYQRVIYRNERLKKFNRYAAQNFGLIKKDSLFHSTMKQSSFDNVSASKKTVSMQTPLGFVSNSSVFLDPKKIASLELSNPVSDGTNSYAYFNKMVPQIEIKFTQGLLQEAVDNLIQNNKSGVPAEKDSRGRPLKSLSDILKGKQGRFRQYLLGKRVDYSGRSVIIVGPKLKIYQCGIPKEMALELFLPFLLKRILNYNLARTVVGAKSLVNTNKPLVWELLSEIMQVCPVLLNRAPTLHRLGIQAFSPKLVDGRAILLHPLVCSAFNADFDGDQMAVHVPITIEARAEAWKLMLARNNLLSSATGDPISVPSQDMVLGCYYLTSLSTKNRIKQKRGFGFYFKTEMEVLKLYNLKKIDLHANIWIESNGLMEDDNLPEQPFEIRLNKKGIRHEINSKSHRSFDSIGKIINHYIKTTPGKVYFNDIIKNAINFSIF